MTPKMIGCCSKCDAEVFDIAERDPITRIPTRIGPPADAKPRNPAHDDAMRATFQLVDGSRMDLTFCKDCIDSLQPHDLPFLWQRVMLTWETETPGHQNQKTQADNGILGLSHVVPWKDVK